MKQNNPTSNRRDFLKVAGLASLAVSAPGLIKAANGTSSPGSIPANEKMYGLVNFFSDGLSYTPDEYLQKLMEVSKDQAIEADYYSRGGATTALEKEFARLTGKEKAVFLPTGTLANELAIKILSGKNAKVAVPENSHIFRDEADAAQVVHNKRLIPVGKGKPYFDEEILDQSIDYYKRGEAFKSDVGAVAIENPVRRADGTAIPLEKIKSVSSYCREQGYKLHLDGARLIIASAYTGVSMQEYASHFDTVYISLYKYLNAAFGAILCGPAELIDEIPHQVKIHGGAAFQTWVSSAMALHHLSTIEDDLKKAKLVGEELVEKLDALPGLTFSTIPEGTNIYKLELDESIDFETLNKRLITDFSMALRNPDPDGKISFYINASILRRPVEEIVEAFKQSMI